MDNVNNVEDFKYQTTDLTNPMQVWEMERYEIAIILNISGRKANMAMMLLSEAFLRGQEQAGSEFNPYTMPKIGK